MNFKSSGHSINSVILKLKQSGWGRKMKESHKLNASEGGAYQGKPQQNPFFLCPKCKSNKTFSFGNNVFS